eukprot:132178-Rhodomonas_salina.1
MATYTKVRPYVPALGVSGEAPPVGSSQKPTLYTVEQLAFQMPAIVELEGSIPSAMHTSASAEHSLDDDLLKPSDFRGDTSADNPACPDGSKVSFYTQPSQALKPQAFDGRADNAMCDRVQGSQGAFGHQVLAIARFYCALPEFRRG